MLPAIDATLPVWNFGSFLVTADFTAIELNKWRKRSCERRVVRA
jgi:hypothetical protein